PVPVCGKFPGYGSEFLPGQRKAARKAPQKPPAPPWEGESRFLKDFLFSPVFQEEGQRKGKGPEGGEDRRKGIFLCSLLTAERPDCPALSGNFLAPQIQFPLLSEKTGGIRLQRESV